jgi:hypothetical protein
VHSEFEGRPAFPEKGILTVLVKRCKEISTASVARERAGPIKLMTCEKLQIYRLRSKWRHMENREN